MAAAAADVAGRQQSAAGSAGMGHRDIKLCVYLSDNGVDRYRVH
jgi:hypothetical protein